MTAEDPTGPQGPGPTDDATLLAAVARVWALADPPPSDLADGVLARLAAQDLEFELLTLVEGAGAMDGVRHAAPEGEESGSWSLEYEGAGLRVYVHLTLVEGRHRLDGWVVPAQPLTVELRTEGHDEPVVTTADELGRFEVEDAPAGLSRLGFPPVAASERPRMTPPFWI